MAESLRLTVGSFLKHTPLREAVERGDFTREDVVRAVELTRQAKADILVPGGPRRIARKQEVFLCAAERLKPTEPLTQARRVQVLLENLVADFSDPRFTFRVYQPRG